MSGRRGARARPGRGQRGAVRLFPGIEPGLLRTMLSVRAGRGARDLRSRQRPPRDGALLEVIAEATARGVVIVNCTQCLRGRVDMGGYATGAAPQGRRRQRADMTPEADPYQAHLAAGKRAATGGVSDQLARTCAENLPPDGASR